MCTVTTIKHLCAEAVRMHAAGDFIGADFLLHQACTQAKSLGAPILEAKILNTMAAFRVEDKRARTAVPLLAKAREKVDARIGRNNKLYAIISSNLLQAEVTVIMEAAPAATA